MVINYYKTPDHFINSFSGVTKLICHSEATTMFKKSIECKSPLFLLKGDGDQSSVTHIDVTDKGNVIKQHLIITINLETLNKYSCSISFAFSSKHCRP